MNLDNLKTTDGIDVAGKRVLYRADLNVPAKDGAVTDATRLERVVPGLKALAARGAKVIVLSHFGRPKAGPDKENSLAPVAAALGGLLQRHVSLAGDCIGQHAHTIVDAMKPGDICVLENTRFHKGEEKNDPAFTQQLAELGDIFVNDAFSAAHRAHASTEGLTHHLPSYAGPLMMEEINALKSALEVPKRPTAAVVGGAKVSTKIPILTNLVAKVDKLIIGGGMANTFLQSLGVQVAQSLAEPEFHSTAREIMAEAKSHGLPDHPADRCRHRARVQGGCRDRNGRHPQGADRRDDPRHRPRIHRQHDGTSARVPHAALERSDGRVRDRAVRRRHVHAWRAKPPMLTRGGTLLSIAGGGDTVAALNAAGVTERFLLRLDRRRRLPRMARRQRTAGRGGARAVSRHPRRDLRSRRDAHR